MSTTIMSETITTTTTENPLADKVSEILNSPTYAIPVEAVVTAYDETGWQAVNGTWTRGHGAGCAMAVLAKHRLGYNYSSGAYDSGKRDDMESAIDKVAKQFGVGGGYVSELISGFDSGDSSRSARVNGNSLAYENGCAIREATVSRFTTVRMPKRTTPVVSV